MDAGIDLSPSRSRVFSPVKGEYCLPGKRQSSRDAKFLQIVDYLMKNGRAQLTEMAKDLGIPKSTIFDYMKLINSRYTFTIKPREAYPYDKKPF